MFSIFERDCFPRRLTTPWLGYQSPCKALAASKAAGAKSRCSQLSCVQVQLCPQAFRDPGTTLAEPISGAEPKTGLMPPLVLSVGMGKTAGGSPRNYGCKKDPNKHRLAPRLLLPDSYVAWRWSAVAYEYWTKGWMSHTHPISPLLLWPARSWEAKQKILQQLHSTWYAMLV